MRKSILIVILASTLIAASCGSDENSSSPDSVASSETSPDTTASDTTTTTTPEVDPAAAFCGRQGGSIETDSQTEEDLCVLPDGRRIPVEEFFTSFQTPPVTAAKTEVAYSEGTIGWFPAIAIGADGNPIISHFDRDNGDLLVTHCQDPSCEIGRAHV